MKQRVEEPFEEVGQRHETETGKMEVASDHVHFFVSFPPRLSISKVVGKFKAISAKVVFEEFPGVKREMWSGGLWEDGYFARTVGDNTNCRN